MKPTKGQELLAFIIEVQRYRGNRLSKLIKDNKNNTNIQKFLQYTYDTNEYVYNTTVDAISDYGVASLSNAELQYMYATLDKLRAKEIIGAEATRVTKSLVELYGIIAYSIFHRKIPNATLGKVTINKAIPGLITDFKVQKAKEIDWRYVRYPVRVETKYDGNFVVITNKGCYTRTGIPFYWPDIPLPFTGQIICEAIVGDGKLGDRSKVQGIITQSRRGTLTYGKAALVHFVALDYLTDEEAKTNVCTHTYEERLKKLQVLIKYLNLQFEQYSTDLKKVATPGYKPFSMTESIMADSKAEVQAQILTLNRAGYEGVVLKTLDSMYEFKRSRAWMRCKVANSADLVCVDYVVATKGKHAGLLKHLVCVGIVEGTQVQVNVGQGFSDNMRKKPRDYYVGYTIEVTYNEVTVNDSLSIPIFIERREKWDKQGGYNA